MRKNIISMLRCYLVKHYQYIIPRSKWQLYLNGFFYTLKIPSKSFGSCTICKSSRPRSGKRQTAEWNRNSISRPSWYPFGARESPSWNHHTITLIRVSFIFRSPFLFFLTLHYVARRANESSNPHLQPSPFLYLVSCSIDRATLKCAEFLM